MAAVLEYRCPRCRGELDTGRDVYRCAACARDFPIVLGIPDFRLFPDPYLSLAEDRDKARRLAEDAGELDFRGLLRHYWSITPDTPAAMEQRFIDHAVAGVERGRHLLAGLGDAGHGSLLELGCRSGGLLVAAAERFEHVTGIDIALRWLVVARRRLAEEGVAAELCCCCAEQLPFADCRFDAVVAENVLEHAAGHEALVTEAHRALRPAGVFLARTWNRFAAAPEPHVRLWGVGWLPRGLARRWVRRRRGVEYRHVRLISVFALRRLLLRAAFADVRIRPASFSAVEQGRLSPGARAVLGVYHRIKDWPLIRSVLLVLGPVLEALCVRRGGHG